MELVSLSFLFLFLPASILVMWVAPVRHRPLTLLILSGVFYWWSEGWNLLVLCSVVLLDYFTVRIVERFQAPVFYRRLLMSVSVAKSLMAVVYYGVMNHAFGLHIPLGLNVVCLTSVAYVIDYCNDLGRMEKNIPRFALMNLFFPRLYAGPIARTGMMEPQFQDMHMTLSKTGMGAQILIRGLAKKVVLADRLFIVYQEIQGTSIYTVSTLSVWLMLISLAMAVYFLLSGYADIAKGIGMLFGFQLPDNFNYPYMATSIDGFLSSFNITVTRFYKRYIHFYLGSGKNQNLILAMRSILLCLFVVCWFGLGANYLLMALYLAVFLILERNFALHFEKRLPDFFKWLITAFILLGAFLFVAGGTPWHSFAYFRILFGMGGVQATSSQAVYLLRSNWLLLAVGALCCTSCFKWLGEFFYKRIPHVSEFASLLVQMVMLILVVIVMV